MSAHERSLRITVYIIQHGRTVAACGVTLTACVVAQKQCVLLNTATRFSRSDPAKSSRLDKRLLVVGS